MTSDQCMVGGCSKFGCEGGFYCFNADGTRKVVTDEKKRELHEALENFRRSAAQRSGAGQEQIDALIAEHSEWTGHGYAIVDGHRRRFAKALIDLISVSKLATQAKCAECAEGMVYSDVEPTGSPCPTCHPPLLQWQDGAGLLWDVFDRHGKWFKRVVSPIGWDAHAVYLVMMEARYAPHIDIRLVSSTTGASPDTPAPVLDEERAIPSAETMVSEWLEKCHFEATDEQRQRMQWFCEFVREHDAARAASPQSAPVQTLTEDARECLMDVVSHYDDFRTAIVEVKAANETMTSSDILYWEKQIKVLERMKGQAERVLARAPQALANGEPRLDKPAQVGGTRFGVGVKWSTVIGAAQRHFEYMNTPEKEAERNAKGNALMEVLRNGGREQSQELAKENDALFGALAECRNAFPVPDAGSPLESYWASAMGDPLEVPGFVRAALAAQAELLGGNLKILED